MRYIIAATAFALIAGINLGFLLSRGLDGSASAAPPTQAVEEQNLDGSGFIRVHEQGVADVNVTNPSLPVSGTVDVGNLPAVQDVNVVSVPPEQGRLIELGTQAIPGGGHYQSSFVDVSDCERVTLMARGTSGVSHSINEAEMSPDGTIAVLANLVVEELGGNGKASSSWHNLEVAMPFIRFRVSHASSSTSTNITAWIWCTP